MLVTMQFTARISSERHFSGKALELRKPTAGIQLFDPAKLTI